MNIWESTAGKIKVILGVLAILAALVGLLHERFTILRDLQELQDSANALQSSVTIMGNQVAEIHSTISDGGWQAYSAWQWQLDMDRIFAVHLNLKVGEDFREPPEFLQKRPGYSGP